MSTISEHTALSGIKISHYLIQSILLQTPSRNGAETAIRNGWTDASNTDSGSKDFFETDCGHRSPRPGKRPNSKLIHGKTGKKARSEYAFTILELMVAIFIFSIVVTTVFGSFRYLFSTSENLQADTELSQMARDCLQRMTLDLQGFYISLPPLYKPPEFNEDPNDYRLVGDTSDVGRGDFGRLRFASLSHVKFRQDPRQGVAEIIYYAVTDNEDNTIIRRKDNLYPYPEDFEESTADPVLCENVVGLKFTYFDEDGNEHERWDSEENEYEWASPVAVEIELSVGDEEFPMILRSRVALPIHRSPMEKES